ncbi:MULTISPECIES: YbhN family protein [Parafrankia]|uniref:lysylphosphatidylglycerol synthase transmembrane domain-containing protein n=1 Tax=Parafrankia TaxID=2994362 RepID=UPI000DA445CA
MPAVLGGVDATGAAAVAVELTRAPRGFGLRRTRLRVLAAVVVVGAVGALVGTRFRSDVLGTLSDVPAPRWHWLVVCLLASVLFYVAHGVSVRAASGLRMSLGTATASQLAAAAANRVVPAGLGAIAVHLRFLERRGMTRPAAVAAVASIKGAAFLVHLAGIALVAGTLRGSGVGEAVTAPVRMTVNGIGAGPVAAGLTVVGVGIGTAAAHPRVRTRLRPALRGFRAHLAVLARSPGRTVVLVTSTAATKAAQVMGLACAVWSFESGLSIASITAVYLVGSVVAGAAPTAGSVGAIEPALVIGLTASGGTAATMFAAVLVFRLISYWLPILPGVTALAMMRRRGDL